MSQDTTATSQVPSQEYLWRIVKSSSGMTGTAYSPSVEAESKPHGSWLCKGVFSDVDDTDSLVEFVEHITQAAEIVGWGSPLSIGIFGRKSHYDAPHFGPYLWYLPKITEDSGSIEGAIYAEYCNIEQVQAIYVLQLAKMYQVFVLLSQEHFDDSLMDHLLDHEEKVLDLQPNTLFDFHYLPLLEGDQARPVPKNAMLIFAR